jgi:hypothetical protein
VAGKELAGAFYRKRVKIWTDAPTSRSISRNSLLFLSYRLDRILQLVLA